MGAEDDFMPVICWTQYFMEAQEYHVQDIFCSRTARV
jgi:hypothetical protein